MRYCGPRYGAIGLTGEPLCCCWKLLQETLHRQLPGSVMAQEWCLAYGVLPVDEADKLYRALCKQKGVKPSESPMKASRAAPAAKKRKASAGRVVKEDGDGATGFDAGNAFEGVGASGI
eukprot:TRINITY_DN2946_c0_g1_i2.p1 TRINITY_DN2946_c0_g1~~TRINITY_DN2946_c0_g1_i2.p1  ORF type:complete len:119 (-),score=23.57 TRINITY_DN2946_c0_g1_i2:302-658(-)